MWSRSMLSSRLSQLLGWVCMNVVGGTLAEKTCLPLHLQEYMRKLPCAGSFNLNRNFSRKVASATWVMLWHIFFVGLFFRLRRDSSLCGELWNGRGFKSRSEHTLCCSCFLKFVLHGFHFWDGIFYAYIILHSPLDLHCFPLRPSTHPAFSSYCCPCHDHGY